MVKSSVIKHTSLSFLLLALGALSISVLSQAKDQEASTSSLTKPRSEKHIKSLVKISDDQESITLPLRVFIISDLQLENKDVKMTTWVTPQQVEHTILPEINRIWKPSGIQWELECIITQSAADLPTQEEHIKYVQNSVREAKGTKNKKFSERNDKIEELCGKKNQHPHVQNLYLFPYLGQTYQGFARIRGNTAYLGVWTDKHTRGERPPEKVLLTEPEPMNRGSLARTAAHELGHNLGLFHPDKPTQKIFNRVMGGRQQGYQLTADEITTARAIALKRAKSILTN